MPRYSINGKTYNIPDDKVEDFLSKNPKALLVQDEPAITDVSNEEFMNMSQDDMTKSVQLQKEKIFTPNYYEETVDDSIQVEQPEQEEFEVYKKENIKVDRKALYGDSYDEFNEIMNIVTNNNLGFNEKELEQLNEDASGLFGEEIDGAIEQPNLNPNNLMTQEQFDLIGEGTSKATGFDFFGVKEWFLTKLTESTARDKDPSKVLDEPTQQKITTVLDYKKQALNYLKEQGLESPSETEILKAAKQLYVDDKKEDEFNRELEEYIEDLDGKRNIFTFAKGDEQNRLAQIAKIAKSTLDNKSKVLLARSESLIGFTNDKGEFVPGELQKVNEELEKLLQTEYKTPEEQAAAREKALILNKERNNLLRQYDRINEEQKVLIEDDEQLGQFADQIGRNFNWMPNLGGKTLVALTDLGMNLEEVIHRFNPKTLLQNQILANKEKMPDWAVGLAQLRKNDRDKVLSKYDAWKNNITGSLAEPQNFAENKTIEDWVEWGVDTIATQGPQTALMIAAPASSLYIISASSTGSKFKEMQREIDLGMEDYSPWQIYTTSTITGLAEGLSEKVTLGQLKRVKLGIQATNRAKSGVVRQLKDNFFNIRSLKAGIYDPIEEGATEVLSQITGNLADKFIAGKEDVNIYDGVKESFVSGVFMSGLVYKSPYVANLVSAPFRTTTLDTKFNNNARQIIQLSNQLDTKNLDTKTKDILESKITELVKANSEIKVNQSLAIDYLTKPQQDNLVSLYQQEVQNTRLINQFQNDPALKNSKDAKAQIVQLKTENGIIQKQRGEIMAPAIQKRLDSDMSFAEATAQKLNLPEIKSLSTAQITKEFGTTLANKDGFFNKSTGEIVINPEVAAKTEAVTVGSHEVLHGILNQTLNTTTPEGLQQAQTVVQDFRKQLSPEQNAILDQKLQSYSLEYLQRNPDEVLTQFSDGILKNEIKFEESIFTKIGNAITPILRKFGFSKIKFNTGKDVYSFLKDYTKSVKQGQISQDIVSAVKDVSPTIDPKSGVAYSTGIDTNTVVDNLAKKGLEVSEKQINDMVGKIASRATTKFWSRMSASNKNIVPKQLYKDSAKNLLLEIANGYRKEISKNTGKQVTFDAYMANTGMQRLNSLAADLGTKQKDDKSLSDEATLRKVEQQQTAQETSTVKPEVKPTIDVMSFANRINPSINTKAFEKEFTDAVIKNAKDKGINLNDPNLTVTQLQSITPYNVLAKALNIPTNKISNPKDNLGKSESLKVQKALLQARTFVKNVVLSKANKDVQQVASKKKGGKPVKIGGETLKLGTNILNTFFNPPKRVGNNNVRTPKKFDNKVYEQSIGIKDGKVDPNYKPRDAESQVMKGLVKGIAEQMTNRAIARQPDVTAEVQANLDRGKSDLVYSASKLIKDPKLQEIRKKLKINGATITKVVENAMIKAAQDTEFLGNNSEMVNELLDIASAEIKPLVLEAKAIFTGLQLQQKFPNRFKVINKGIETDNAKTDVQTQISNDNGKTWTDFNIEIKAKNGQFGSLTINDLNFSNGKFNVVGNFQNADALDLLLSKLDTKAFQEIALTAGVDINSLSDTMTVEQYDLIKDSIYKGKAGLQLLSNPDLNGGFTFKDVAEIYANKKTPTHYMQIEGLGLVAIGKDIYGLGVPSLENQPVSFYARPFKQSIKSKGKKTGRVKIIMRITPQSNANTFKNVPKSDIDITKLSDLETIVNDIVFSETANKNLQNAKTKANDIKENGYVYSQSPKGKKAINKIKDSQPKDLNKDFNDIIQENKGVKSEARYSDIAARREGRGKGKFKFFLPPGAEDFKGLIYTFLGKGKKGEQQFKFFDNNLIKPYQQAVAQIERFRRSLKGDYATLLKNNPNAKKKLGEKIPTKGKTDFTYDQAVRAFLMNQSGFDLTEAGLSKRDAKLLVDTISNDPVMASFAQGLQLITKQDTWLSPNGGFDVQTIQSDLHRLTSGEGRKRFLDNSGFIENSSQIFNKANLNKIEATYGIGVRESIEDMMYRMKNGTNRPSGTNRLTNSFNNWVNRSIGAIMFFNRKSALLQTISSVNFVNWSDNNPVKAAAAFANQPQYWKDFSTIFNSPKLKERRAGLKGDINEAELASAVEGATNKAEAALSWLLKKGFLPTQMADSFAIASGGATFYRNRINTYTKQGVDQKAAEEKAFEDFSRISEESQQSADPSMISEQQASPLGRLILAFQNTPMQYTRLMKRAGQDLINGRGDAKTHISKIIYYGAVQNFMFAALQNALFAVIPGFSGEDDEEEVEDKSQKKYVRIANNMVDTILRGSGVYGAVGATLKNTLIKFYENEGKDPFQKDNASILLEAINLSPPIGSKLRKLNNALKTREYEKDVIEERGWEITRNGRVNLSPSYRVLGSTAEAILNIPLERTIAEISALTEMTDQRNSSLERIALALGWRTWDLGVPNEEEDQIKVEAKERKKQERKDKLKKEREEKKRLEEEKRFEGLSNKEINNLKRRDQIQSLTKKQQVDSLVALGVSKATIRSLRLESDRIDKIIEINTK